jgi:hypothetical protein
VSWQLEKSRVTRWPGNWACWYSRPASPPGRQKKRRRHGEEHAHLLAVGERALERLGVEIHDPLGEPLTEELLQTVEVVGTVEKPRIKGDVVGETLEPVIRYRGKIINFAKWCAGWVSPGKKPVPVKK